MRWSCCLGNETVTVGVYSFLPSALPCTLKVKAWTPADARLHWSWKSPEEGYVVKASDALLASHPRIPMCQCNVFWFGCGSVRIVRGILRMYAKQEWLYREGKNPSPCSHVLLLALFVAVVLVRVLIAAGRYKYDRTF